MQRLVIDGVEKNPGPCVEAGKILLALLSGRDRNLKSELNVLRVDAGFIEALVMLKLK